MNKDDNAFLSELKTRMDFQAASIDAELAKQNALEAYRYYTDSVDNLNNIRMALGMDTSNKGYYKARRGACLPKAEDGLTKEQIQEAANWMATNYSGEGSMAEEPGNIVGPQPDLASYALQNASAQPTTQSSSFPQIAYKPTKYSYQPVVTRFSTRPTKKITRDRAQRFDDFYGATRNNYDPNFYEVAKQNYMATGIDPNIEKRMKEDGKGLYRHDRFERRGWSPSVGMHYTGLVDDIPAIQTPTEEAPQNTPEQSQETPENTPETPAQDTGLSPEVITSTPTETPSSADDKPVSKSSGSKGTKSGGQNGNKEKGQGVFTGTIIPGSTAAGTAPTSPGTVNNPISWYDNVKGGYTDEYYANINGATGKPRPGYTGSVYKDYDPSQSEAYYNGVKYGTPVIEMARYYGTTPDVMQQYITSGEKYYNPRDWSSIQRYLKQNPTTQVIYYDDPSWIGGFDRGFYQPKLNKNGTYSIGQRIGYTYKKQYGGTTDVSSLVSQYNQLDENQKNEFLSKLGLI